MVVAAQPALAAALVAATRLVGASVVFPASVTAAASKARTSRPPNLTALYKQFGLDSKEIAGMRGIFVQPVTGPVVFPDVISTKSEADASVKAAIALRGFAKFLRMVAGA